MNAKLSPDQLLATHQYQFDGTHKNRNECALCAMAMVLNHAAGIAGREDFKLPASELGRCLDRIPFRYPRFPAWFPGPGGATHPIAASAGLRDYIRQAKLEWGVRLAYRQTQSDLGKLLANGFPSLIYGVGRTGIPHVVVPISRSEDGWQIMDPGYPGERNPMKWTNDQLANWWRNYSIIYPKGTMVSLTPI